MNVCSECMESKKKIQFMSMHDESVVCVFVLCVYEKMQVRSALVNMNITTNANLTWMKMEMLIIKFKIRAFLSSAHHLPCK